MTKDVRGFGDKFNTEGEFQTEQPIPLSPDLGDSAPYPIDALGDTLAKACRAIMDKVQVPDALAAQSVLSAASLCVQPFVDIQLPTSEIRPTCLFMTTVAGTGDQVTALIEASESCGSNACAIERLND